jgi:hypothetical protein
MSKKISRSAKKELLQALRERYRISSKNEKSRILDEFKTLMSFHRKHAIRLLNKQSADSQAKNDYGRRIYDEAVREALVVIWEAGDRICGKRLKPYCQHWRMLWSVMAI